MSCFAPGIENNGCPTCFGNGYILARKLCTRIRASSRGVDRLPSALRGQKGGMSAYLLALAKPWVEHITQTVAHQIESGDGKQDGYAGES